MKKTLILLTLLTSISTFATPTSKFVSIDKKIFNSLKNDLSLFPQPSSITHESIILKLTFPQIEELSHQIHNKLHRCGGFTAHSSLSEARKRSNKNAPVFRMNLIDYSIDQQDIASLLVDQVSEIKIRTMIEQLSSFENRHFLSETGVEASQLIYETWKNLSSHRSDVKVEYFQHEEWSQPSVILTIEGSDLPDEIVILGGHSDSIALDGNNAPGADDNASGISSITEVLRILMVNNIKPKRTIQFMAYAAEEVGLLGSNEISLSHRLSQKQVIGVLQLDMTLFKGTESKDIVLMSDFTDQSQNKFLGKIIDEYVKVPWGYSQCGYGCSDHASWTAAGYPASFPFEAEMSDYNPSIHTKHDTIENAGGSADHAVKFTKLATAYLIELSN